MTDYTQNPWLPNQLYRLKAMVEDRVPYREIAVQLGHPISSCRTMMRNLRGKRGKPDPAKDPAQSEAARKPAPLRFNQHAPATARDLQPTSTFAYVMDAELRARIEGQGVTAGLLGDPVKGRSALDKIERGEELPPPLMDSDLARFAPRRVAPWVTLAEGPLR